MTRKLKILVIDDDPRLSDLIGDFCVEFGFDAQTVNDSREAISKAADWKPDVITLDLEMPDLNGFQVLKGLKDNPATRGIPVMVVSVAASETHIEKGEVEGVFDKPIHFRRLFSKIRQILPQVASA